MAETRWLTDEERWAWLRLVAVLEMLPAALDAQLIRDEGLTQFDYMVLSMLSESEHRTLRMTALAARTNATLSRLSRVVSRLEKAGFVRRSPCPEDARATNTTLTEQGWAKLVHAAPGHVEMVRNTVVDPLTPSQLRQLGQIAARLLPRLDPDGRMTGPLFR